MSTATPVARDSGARRHPVREAFLRTPSLAYKEEPRASSDEHVHSGSAASAPRGLTSRMPAPMRVDWREVVSEDGALSLVAEVERRVGFDADIEVSIVLPEGARVVEGSTDFMLPKSAGAQARATPCVVAVAPGVVPETDLVLSAQARGGSFGAHAEARYIFGRGLRLEQHPSPTGPVLPARFLSGGDSDAADAP
ncbi:hypothetical protein ACN47A_02615 [Myxococcus fulvus]|uniref:hypothetical protein n=1 Tax=Myxococcus fulvus TaxID=33 RepID=UPI003B9C8D22